MSKVLLKDVAARAGVSLSAASICLRHGEGFAPATIARVREAADELGYGAPAGAHPRTAARTGVAGVVLHGAPSTTLQCGHTLEILRGLAQELVDMGMAVEFLPASQSPEHAGPYGAIEADIVFYLSVGEPAHYTTALLRGRGIPTVHLQSTVGGPVAAVRTSDTEPMRQLASHLVELGHERIAVVTQRIGLLPGEGLVADANWEDAQILHSRHRLQGIAEAGITPCAVFECRASTIESGLKAGRTLLDLHPRPTAIICLTDMLAAGVMVVARERGLDVPGDLSVTGWDGVELPSLAPHRLTTVLQSGMQKGVLLAAYGRAVLAGQTPAPFHVPQYVSLGTTTDRLQSRPSSPAPMAQAR